MEKFYEQGESRVFTEQWQKRAEAGFRPSKHSATAKRYCRFDGRVPAGSSFLQLRYAETRHSTEQKKNEVELPGKTDMEPPGEKARLFSKNTPGCTISLAELSMEDM